MKSIVLFLFLIPVTVFARTPSQGLLQKLMLPLKTCPERVWPGYRPFVNTDFIITVPSTNRSFVINESGVTEKTAEEFGEEGRGGFSYGEKNGKNYVILNFEDAEEEATSVETLFHEAFHFLGQKDLKATTGRDEMFPVDFDARNARAMQLKNVREFLASQDRKYLEHAAYWENWIKTNRPEEHRANQEWDVIEGSAEFVGLMSAAISDLGCEATDAELMRNVLARSEITQDNTDHTGQSYSAGMLGVVISRLNDSNKTLGSINGSALSEVLLGCNERPEEVDSEVAEEVRANLGPLEALVVSSSDEIFSHDEFVAVPVTNQVGSFSSYGFYRTKRGEDLVLLMPGTTMTISINDKTYSLTQRNMIRDDRGLNPCGVPGEFYVIPREAFPAEMRFSETGTYLGKKLSCPN